MIRLALLAGTTAWHGYSFAGIINRVDRATFRKNGWALYKNRFSGRARITHAWGPDVRGTKRMAAAARIANVVKRPEDVIGCVDGVILADDCKMTHHLTAPLFLEASLPTLVDKPLAPTWAEAQKIVRLARRHKAPLLSCSALRFATEIADRRTIAAKVGRITSCATVGVNELFFYGIHPMELMVTLMGSPIHSVRNVGKPGSAIVRVRFADGRMAVLTVYEKGFAYTLEVTIHGTKGHLHLPITDAQGFYERLLCEFLNMVETRRPPVPYDETLNIIRSLQLARRSGQTHREYSV